MDFMILILTIPHKGVQGKPKAKSVNVESHHMPHNLSEKPKNFLILGLVWSLLMGNYGLELITQKVFGPNVH